MAAQQEPPKEEAVPVGQWLPAVALAWLIPGGGHLLLKRPGRAALISVSVILMFLFGLFMRGAMFTPQGNDPLTILINYGGFVCHVASGIPYLLTNWLGYDQVDMAGHIYDYGAKFLVSAGLLNILAMVDVYEIAAGKKS
jgi:Family of unknown function (DUF6677)